MHATELLDPFERMLGDLFTPAAVRAVEAGEEHDELWNAVEASGFLDALVPEDAGGVGLALRDVGPLMAGLGRYAVPLLVGETMLARWWLASVRIARPAGSIAIGNCGPRMTPFIPSARLADHVLLESDTGLMLADCRDVERELSGVAYDLGARFVRSESIEGWPLPSPAGGLRTLAALLRASQIAGAAERLLEMTLNYANERIQFGKPIGRQQAVQQQLAVMAEHVVATRLAVQTAWAAGLPCDTLAVAMAKYTASSAAAPMAATAHAIHGAIGISEEFDLHLFTRRLHAWRLADGAEDYWSDRLGEARLAAASDSVDFIRQALVFR